MYSQTYFLSRNVQALTRNLGNLKDNQDAQLRNKNWSSQKFDSCTNYVIFFSFNSDSLLSSYHICLVIYPPYVF